MYDSGTVFNPAILDITDDDIRKRFMEGVANIASLSLAIGYIDRIPTAKELIEGIIGEAEDILTSGGVGGWKLRG